MIASTVYYAPHYYVPPTPATGPATPTNIANVPTVAPTYGGGTYTPAPLPYVPGQPANLPGGDVVGDPNGMRYWGQPNTPARPGKSIPAGGVQPTGGPTCVRCNPQTTPNPQAGVPTPPPGTTTTTTTTGALATLAGLPWWVIVLGLVAVASAFADRK